MKLVLTKDVEELGRRGQVVEVAPGYGRNFLLPRGLAVQATPAALREWEVRREKLQHKEGEERREAEGLAAKLSGTALRITAKAGAEGRLYGSVTTKDLSDALEKDFGVAIDRKKIELPEPIKTLGAHPFRVSLHHEVQVDLTVEVLAAEEAS